MKKKILMTSFIAASLMASLSLTSFAGWEQDDYGWYYVNSNGARQGRGWFTDPGDQIDLFHGSGRIYDE